MLIDRIDVPDRLVEPDVWPFTIPAIRQVATEGIALTSNVTVLIGANGSGKSTLLEGIAEAYGIDVRGGHGARRYASAETKARWARHSGCPGRRPAAASPAARPPGSSCGPRPRSGCWRS